MSSGERTPQSTSSSPAISRTTSGVPNEVLDKSINPDHLSDKLKTLNVSPSVHAQKNGPCRYGLQCRNNKCPFNHSPPEVEVVYGRSPGGNLVATEICPAGWECADDNCQRAHPNAYPGARVKERNWCNHACMQCCTGMLQRNGDKTWYEPKCIYNHHKTCRRFEHWQRHHQSCEETDEIFQEMIRRAVVEGNFVGGQLPANFRAETDVINASRVRNYPSARTLAQWLPGESADVEPDDEPDDSLISSSGTVSTTSSACSVTSVASTSSVTNVSMKV